MLIRRHWVVALVVLLAVTLAACNVNRRMQRKSEDLSEDLMKAALDFNRMIAWRYFDEASSVVIPEQQANFMMTAEAIYARVHMEGFKVNLAQVSHEPFPRLHGEVPPPTKPKPEHKVDTPPSLAAQAEKKKKGGAEEPIKKMPKVWYGMVLVRFINVNVAPSSTVRSPLLRQYWYWYEDPGAWLVDPDIEQLLEPNRRGAKTPTHDAKPEPLVPTP